MKNSSGTWKREDKQEGPHIVSDKQEEPHIVSVCSPREFQAVTQKQTQVAQQMCWVGEEDSRETRHLELIGIHCPDQEATNTKGRTFWWAFWLFLSDCSDSMQGQIPTKELFRTPYWSCPRSRSYPALTEFARLLVWKTCRNIWVQWPCCNPNPCKAEAEVWKSEVVGQNLHRHGGKEENWWGWASLGTGHKGAIILHVFLLSFE